MVVLEYQEDAGAGFIGEWLDARGLSWTVVRPDEPEPDASAPAAIISLGSSHSAYASQPAWIPRQLPLLRGALEADTPVLGVCFGAQALALAAGGEVARAVSPEIGWVAPDTEQPELRGPWLAWHYDVITLPPGAVELARSPMALQAYRIGRSVGVQFHPEVTPAIWNEWASREPEIIRRHVAEPERLAAAVDSSGAALRTRLFGLLDWWRRSVLGS
ncbi:MAG: type 1 glutamine amidotransferase [Solirubrobacteraceae bacterium]